MIKVLKRYLAGELPTAVYWAVGLTCPILIPLFMMDVVHDWVVMGMRRQVLLELGALPQIAAGGAGLVLAVGFGIAVCWGILKKLHRSHERPTTMTDKNLPPEQDDVLEYLFEELRHIDFTNQPGLTKQQLEERPPQKGVKGPTLHYTGRGHQGERDADE